MTADIAGKLVKEFHHNAADALGPEGVGLVIQLKHLLQKRLNGVRALDMAAVQLTKRIPYVIRQFRRQSHKLLRLGGQLKNQIKQFGFFFAAIAGTVPLVGARDKTIAALGGVLHAFHLVLLVPVIVEAHLELIGMNVAKQALLGMGGQLHLSQRIQMRYSQRRKMDQLPFFLQFRLPPSVWICIPRQRPTIPEVGARRRICRGALRRLVGIVRCCHIPANGSRRWTSGTAQDTT